MTLMEIEARITQLLKDGESDWLQSLRGIFTRPKKYQNNFSPTGQFSHTRLHTYVKI